MSDDPPTLLGIAMLEKRLDESEPVLTRYVYPNHLQSASLELDENAAIVSYEEYHPYGTTAFQAKSATINAVAKRYRYTSKERDEESGLYYHGARYYIPWLCRWTAIDPMESKYAGMSPYNYSFNNPVMWNDLSGADPGDPPKVTSEVIPYNSVDKTAYNPVNIYEQPKENGHLTPDGGRIRFPKGATVTGTSNGGMTTIEGSTTGVLANVLAGALTSFTLEGESYNAHFRYSDGSFMGYYSESDPSHNISYDQNNLPLIYNIMRLQPFYYRGRELQSQ